MSNTNLTAHGSGALKRENAELRRLLQEEWEANHFEHCGRDWPHASGHICRWPPPAILNLGEDAAGLGNDLR
jgi:hypothetical protein